MRRIHIIGGKNHGKTTLVCALVEELTRRGLRVGTIKHTHHHHELDTPGKDSHRHRKSGAAVVGILSRTMSAVFWPNTPTDSSDDVTHTDERYAPFDEAFSMCDVVVVEGDTRTNAVKLEVWRAALDTPPIWKQIEHVHAIVTDDPVDNHRPVLPRSDVPAIADYLTRILEGWPDNAVS